MSETIKNEKQAEKQAEKHEFQAEVREVLNLMIHSLYSNREIFLRELISNSSDACDKLRFKALSNADLMGGDAELRIQIETDDEAGTVTIRDNGIGMTRDEVVENIGTIARSGTRKFMESMAADKDKKAKDKKAKDQKGKDQKGKNGNKKDKGTDASNLIGQFGVGFYSSFIVADNVTLRTRAAGSDAAQGVQWESDGAGEYTLAQIELPSQGTEIVLHLREDAKEFASSWKVRSLVQKYSDHIGFPIYMQKAPPAPEEGEEEAVATEPEWEAVNQSSALWTLQKSEISSEDYQSFYKHISHDFEDPLAWTHNRVEGSQNYTSLLYIPSKAPYDMMMQRDERQGLRLYVHRVFIMDAAEQLLPQYLRFMRGVIDSDDLPLNVSRELLQENELVSKIRSAVVRRSLDLLERMADKEQEKYNQFWDQFGQALKEGLVEDMGNSGKIAKLLRFSSTGDAAKEQRVTLEDYVSRMKEDQEEIWYVTAENRKAAENSPHLEIFRKNGIEVLLMSDRVDEWAMGYFNEFEGKKMRSIAKGDVDFSDKKDDKDGEDKKDEPKDPMLERLSAVLAADVSEVRASHRLVDSASCLVLNEQEMALHLRRMLEQAGQEMPDSKPSLEVNMEHPLLKKLVDMESDDDFGEWAHLLYEQALLSEGGQLEDPAAFVQRMNRLMMHTA